MILDWMMPEMDGLSSFSVRDVNNRLPVLMLTARDAVEDRVEGLKARMIIWLSPSPPQNWWRGALSPGGDATGRNRGAICRPKT